MTGRKIAIDSMVLFTFELVFDFGTESNNFVNCSLNCSANFFLAISVVGDVVSVDLSVTFVGFFIRFNCFTISSSKKFRVPENG